MKLLLIQLSDMHFENTEQTHSIKVDKMISAIKANADAEECIIVISGDLAAKGKKTDYQFVYDKCDRSTSCVNILVYGI